MNAWGYELVPVDKNGEPKPATSSTRGAYRAMLTDFLAGTEERVIVRYGKRDPQAVYMGLRQARQADAPKFDGVQIRREGSNPHAAKVFLEK